MNAINQRTLDLIKGFESLQLTAYKCPAGVWTIGYGHTGGVHEGSVITEGQAVQLLEGDLEWAKNEVVEHVIMPLNDNQFGALVSFCFNVGPSAFANSTLVYLLNHGNYCTVPDQLAKWVKATDPHTGQKIILPGLVRRRAAEAELWEAPDA